MTVLLFGIYILLSGTSFAGETRTDVVCWALCKREGFDGGSYEAPTKSCLCVVRKPLKEIIDPAIPMTSTHLYGGIDHDNGVRYLFKN